MQEGDALAFRSDPRCLVDESQSGIAAARKRTVEVVYGKADVVNSGPPLGDEFSDGRVFRLGLEKLDERLPGGNASYGGTVGVVQVDLRHAQDVAVEGEQRIVRCGSDADVRDACSATNGVPVGRGVHDGFGHVNMA